MKIAVIAGGNSAERDVSWASGSKISNALADSGFEVALIDPWLGVHFENGQTARDLFRARPAYRDFNYQVPATVPDLRALEEKRGKGALGYFGANVLDVCRAADVVFIAMHGAAGENGQIQASFDLLGIRYTGSNFAACVIAMDKHLTKMQIQGAGQLTPEWIYARNENEVDFKRVAEKIGYPCVVKPPRGGSSVGISFPKNETELRDSLRFATEADRTGSDGDVLIEMRIEGREFSVGILDGKALPPIEIIPKTGWFDYASKYQSDLTNEVCPADITSELDMKLRAAALETHRALRLGYYARIDFRVDAEETCYILEANTLPGMTPGSLLPKEASADGVSYTELCRRIALDAIERSGEN